MSAPAGRHSLAGALNATRDHRHDVLCARLDETGRDGLWAEDRTEVLAMHRRLTVMWSHTGPGRRDKWATALAQDLAARGLGDVTLTIEGAPL